ncbi:hypothetical protein [Paractinoplanes atraurantiacus]|uniref:Uncharacterized protein n=1 Tax=Paractinoplanes atraurantiacus TaxID=1036182 RepID=A0A285H076_9ACTN|nr:hypothetical protein [Actinoplanes atraurantiacus]SNY28963.1 hypothetical protein SAMN05421748_103166 [Actinoplanes atraurantiacus]
MTEPTEDMIVAAIEAGRATILDDEVVAAKACAAAVLAIVDRDHAAEVAKLRADIEIGGRAKALALKQAADVVAAARAVAAELRTLAVDQRAEAAPWLHTSSPLQWAPNRAAEAYERAAGMVEQLVGGEPS